jgi:hypothetical protein
MQRSRNVAGNGFGNGPRRGQTTSGIPASRVSAFQPSLALRPLAIWFAALGLSAIPWHSLDEIQPTPARLAQARLAQALFARGQEPSSAESQPSWARAGMPTALPSGATQAAAAPVVTPPADAPVRVEVAVKTAAEIPAVVAAGPLAELFEPASLLGSAPVRLGEALPLSAEFKGPGAASAPVKDEAVAQAPLPAEDTDERIVTAALDPAEVAPVPLDRPSIMDIPEPPPRPFSLTAPSIPERPRMAQPLPTRRTREALAPTPPADDRGFFEKLFGAQKSNGSALAYAVPQDDVLDAARGRRLSPTQAASAGTAVYDISARVVYLPTGEKLEAHSGLGDRRDDPRFVHVSMKGATPPHLYDLSLREQLFHGVRALRLNPIGGAGAIHNRVGLLAHTFMLGPNGDSNGCISFRDYDRFLQAYLKGDVKRLLVVASAS